MLTTLDELSAAEQACLELAWQALLADTTPVGAVVTDADGVIIGSGRNAVYGAADPPMLSGSLLAHAEINALLGLPVSKRHSGCRLVTSLEPCQLCAGAVRMATVGALTYVGADPLNGSAWVLASARYVGRQPVEIRGPRTDQVGRLASGLHVAFYLRRRPDGPVVAAYRKMRPDLAAAGEALIEAGIFDLVRSQVPWPAAGGELLAAV
jgi:tRNA(adenine34) deaminase